jgi:hypothetical protein
VELQENYAAFEALDAEIIAIAQEEADASTLVRAERFVNNQFPTVADPERASLKSIARFGVTLVDKQGVIRTVLPGTLGGRPRLDMIVAELAALEGVEPPPIKPGGIRTGGGKGHLGVDDADQVLDVRWMWSHDQVRPGDDFKLAFLPSIADGFHVYGSQETLMSPFKVSLELPQGIRTAGPIGYPMGHAWDDPGLGTEMKVYEGDIPLGTFLFRADDDIPEGKVTVVVTMQFQACTDSFCFAPTTKTLALELQIAPAGTRRTGVVSWQTW